MLEPKPISTYLNEKNSATQNTLPTYGVAVINKDINT